MSALAIESRFTVGGVLRLTLGIFRRIWGRLLVLFLLEIAAAAVLGVIVERLLAPASPVLAKVVALLIRYAVGTLLSGAVVALGQAAAQGRSYGVVQALGSAARRFAPLFVIGLLQFVAVAAGFLLLIVPGIIAAIIFIVAIPVGLIEDAGPIESLSRSASRTKAHFWALLGVISVVPIAFLILAAVAVLLLVLWRGEALVISVALCCGAVVFGFALFVLILPVAIYLALSAATPHALGPAEGDALYRSEVSGGTIDGR